MKTIKDTSKTYSKIKDTSKTYPNVDPSEVASSLGAEIIGQNSSPSDHIGTYGAMQRVLDQKREEDRAKEEQDEELTAKN
jgi:hypothetical protein